MSLDPELRRALSEYINHHEGDDWQMFLRRQNEIDFIRNATEGIAIGHGKALYNRPTIDINQIKQIIDERNESFQEKLIRFIDEKRMTDAECYKKANIDRRLFSKIRCNRDYTPKKNTILALCIALELTLDETDSLLERAGYILSHSNKGDLIVEYFISRRIYDIFEINEALSEFNQGLLGGV